MHIFYHFKSKKQKYLPLLFCFLLLLLFPLFILACSNAPNDSSSNTKQATITLTISAAASLKDALLELKEIYQQKNPTVNIVYNFGATGALKQQIENGAPVDLFVSASLKQIDELKNKSLLEDEYIKNLLSNNIVLIVPQSSTLSIDFPELTQTTVKKLALGEPSTSPAGEYAKEVLQHFDIFKQLQNKIVFGKDVRTVLNWIETENADVGIVYETDAKLSNKVKVIATAKPNTHQPIVYPLAIIKTTKQKDTAKNFFNFLASYESALIFKKYGFNASSN